MRHAQTKPHKKLISTDLGLFKSNTTLDEKKDIFKNNIRLMVAEVHSYCNRTCSFCPNSFIDRRSWIDYLPEDIYLALLTGLKSINYSNRFAYSRYNEPMADSIIYKRIEQASEYLPHASIHANTNGDYINKDSFQEIVNSGLNSLCIQVYLPDDRYKNEKILLEARDFRINQICSRLPSDISFYVKKDLRGWYELDTVYKEMKIAIRWRNFSINGTNRCDLPVKTTKLFLRDSPCRLPFDGCHIDYNTNMMPCCNLRSDYDLHKDTILGCLTDNPNSIFEVFFSEKAINFRKSMIGFKQKKGACSTCNHALFDKTEANIKNEESLINDIELKI